MTNKKIICAAITGAITTKENNPKLPITPDEIVEEAYRCYLAGAAIVHIHVRDEKGNPSLSFKTYKYVVEKIRKKCDVVICISTSNFGIDISDDERYNLYNLDVELASLTFGSLVREKGAIVNSDEFIINSMNKMRERGIKPEIEIFNLEMCERLKKYIKEYKISEIPYVQYIFGSQGGMPADYETICKFMNNMEMNWKWSAAGIGKMQFYTNIISALNGATTVRTGMEDNVYFSHGVKASGNAELVDRVAKTLSYLNMEIATTADARNILNLKKYSY